MSWVKIDDRYAHHPKIHAAGPIAMALDVAGMCHAARHETDGHIPAVSLGVVAPFLTHTKALQAAAKLVEVGRWSKTGDGWQIHDFLDYNPSAAERKTRRDQATDRVQRHREKKREGNALAPRTRNATPRPHPRPAEGGDGAGAVASPPDPPSGPASPTSAIASGDADSAGHPQPQPRPGLTSTDAGPGDPPRNPALVANGALPPQVSAGLDAALGPAWRRRVPSKTDQDPREFEAKREQKLNEFESAFAQELNETETEVEPEGRADEA